VGRHARPPSRVSVADFFAFDFLDRSVLRRGRNRLRRSTTASAARQVGAAGATAAKLYPANIEVAELVARACPRIVLTRPDGATLHDLVRACDRELEAEAAPGRACDLDLDGLCVK
jgi:hypothetical protein